MPYVFLMKTTIVRKKGSPRSTRPTDPKSAMANKAKGSKKRFSVRAHLDALFREVRTAGLYE